MLFETPAVDVAQRHDLAERMAEEDGQVLVNRLASQADHVRRLVARRRILRQHGDCPANDN